MQPLTHGGDWAGYRAEFGRDPLDFSANVSPLGLPGLIRHNDHPFAKNSLTVRMAVCRTSGAPASSQTTPSMWRNQVS